MPVRLNQTDEDAPPIIEQRDHARGKPAPGKVLCDEAAPAPLVFQFIENIFVIAAIAIQLAVARELLAKRSPRICASHLVEPGEWHAGRIKQGPIVRRNLDVPGRILVGAPGAAGRGRENRFSVQTPGRTL